MLLLIALGGALGSLARYGVAQLARQTGATFPYGTLLVNVSGSLLLGFLVRLFAAHPALAPASVQLGLTIGVCGGFTTFSTFSVDAVRLLQAGEHGRALLYAAASVLLSLGAVWAGMGLAGRVVVGRG